MLAIRAARPGWTTSAHSYPAFVANRHARSRAGMPNGRAGFSPTGTNSRGRSLAMLAAHKGAGLGREGAELLGFLTGLPLCGISRTTPPHMAEVTEQDTDHPHGSVYRVA